MASPIVAMLHYSRKAVLHDPTLLKEKGMLQTSLQPFLSHGTYVPQRSELRRLLTVWYIHNLSMHLAQHLTSVPV